MAQKTLLELMGGIAINVNGDTTIPTTGDDEYLLWQEAINQTQDEWAEIDYNWPQLIKTLRTTLLVSGTSIGLPDDFRKLNGYPTLGTEIIPEVSQEDAFSVSPTDSYLFVDYNGRYLSISPARATTYAFNIRYHSTPTSLTTTTATSLCPSDNFIMNGASAKILFSRDDGKYVEFETKNELLRNQLIGASVHEGIQMDTRVKSKQELRGFTLGIS